MSQINSCCLAKSLFTIKSSVKAAPLIVGFFVPNGPIVRAWYGHHYRPAYRASQAVNGYGQAMEAPRATLLFENICFQIFEINTK